MPATIRARFEGGAGQQLAGQLHLPAGEPRAFVLLAHCFTCGKDLRISTRMAGTLAAAGFGVLRFDFTGLGDSAGEFGETHFSSNVDDLVAAAGYLREHHRAPAMLVGHSLGGAAVLAARPRIAEVAAVVTIGAPAEPEHVSKLVDEAASDGDVLELDVGGRPFRMQRAFLDDLRAQDGAARAAQLDAALLVMHSPQDLVVGIENAQSIYLAARHPKSFISLDGADHLLSTPGDAEYAASTIAAWAGRYLPAAAQAGDAPGEAGSVTASLGSSGLAVDVVAGNHRFRMDEPLDVGGSDTGPTPYDQLLAGLGACTVMTLRMYADRKGWPLRGATVTLSHGRVHARDCEECEATAGRADVIERTLALEGELDGEQRARLLEIADRCPVHRTLTNETRSRTQLLDA